MKIIERLRAISLDVTIPTLIVLLGTALPWARSGEVDRSGFDLARLARRLDVLDGPAAAAVAALLLLPVASAAVAVAGARGQRRIAASLGTVFTVLAVVLAVAVLRSPLQPRIGLHVTMVGAALLAVAGVGAIAGMGIGAADDRPQRNRKPRART